jgi:ABC-type sugar transport system ATPase subunit
MAAATLTLDSIRKSFGGVEVLHGVSLALRGGQVHALVGENGAGKSTLMKTLAGAYTDYSGRILVDGRPTVIRTPRDSEAAGVAVIHQELSLIPARSVADNLFLGREPRGRLGLLKRGVMDRAARALLRDHLDLDIDVRQPVEALPLAWQQLAEIGKALSRDARFVVMDEPTSALSDHETQQLFRVMRRLRKRGVGLVYISHKLEEVFTVADVVTILRDGDVVEHQPIAKLSPETVVQRMIGRPLEQAFPERPPRRGQAVLELKDVAVRDPRQGRTLVSGVNLALQSGEIVGLAGLVGSGASALLQGLFGARGVVTGTVILGGTRLARPTPRAALRRGLALLTNDRQATGIVAPMSALRNVSLPILKRCRRLGLLSPAREFHQVRPFIDRMNVVAPSLDLPVATLSGGNQQKILLARWLATEPRVLLLDDPTRGVDVGAKREIYHLLQQLTAMGIGIVMTSSELPELLGLADRVVVLHRGAIRVRFERGEATQEKVLHAAMGG